MPDHNKILDAYNDGVITREELVAKMQLPPGTPTPERSSTMRRPSPGPGPDRAARPDQDCACDPDKITVSSAQLQYEVNAACAHAYRLGYEAGKPHHDRDIAGVEE